MQKGTHHTEKAKELLRRPNPHTIKHIKAIREGWRKRKERLNAEKTKKTD